MKQNKTKNKPLDIFFQAIQPILSRIFLDQPNSNISLPTPKNKTIKHSYSFPIHITHHPPPPPPPFVQCATMPVLYSIFWLYPPKSHLPSTPSPTTHLHPCLHCSSTTGCSRVTQTKSSFVWKVEFASSRTYSGRRLGYAPSRPRRFVVWWNTSRWQWRRWIRSTSMFSSPRIRRSPRSKKHWACS